jgi:hypothetical protein
VGATPLARATPLAIAKSEKFLKKCEGAVVEISAQSEHFSVLVMKEFKILSLIVNIGF